MTAPQTPALPGGAPAADRPQPGRGAGQGGTPLPRPCCAEALASRVVVSRLMDLLNRKETQLAEARQEIAALERDLGRARPRLWRAW